MKKRLLLIIFVSFIGVFSCMAQWFGGYPSYPTGGYYIGPVYCPPVNYQAMQQQVEMIYRQAGQNMVENAKAMQQAKALMEAQAAYNIQHGITPVVVENSSSSSSSSSTKRSRSSVSSGSSAGKNCRFCAGTGRCKTCTGRGWYYNPLLTNTKTLCPNCYNHDGNCTHCGGKGHL